MGKYFLQYMTRTAILVVAFLFSLATSAYELILSSEFPIALAASEQREIGHHFLSYLTTIDEAHEKPLTQKYADRWQISPVVDGEQLIFELTDLNSGQVYRHHWERKAPLDPAYQLHINLDDSLMKGIEERYFKASQLDPLKPAIPSVDPAEELPKNPWTPQQLDTIQEVMKMERKIIKKWANMIKENELVDPEKRADWIRSGTVHLIDSELGSAEINMIDDTPFVRVAHKKTEISFVIFQDNHDFDSAHFKLYMARQHIDSGESRRDQKLGRDVVVITKNGKSSDKAFGDVENFHSFKRYRSFISPRWWEDYVRSTYKRPTIPNVGFGAVCGLSQGVMGLCVAGLSKLVDPASDIDLTPAGFSTVWGTGIGIFVSTYKNWINRGTKLLRTLKSSSNSLIFAYGLVALMHPDGLESLSITDWEGVFLNLSILGNVWANNLAKVHWQDFARVREFIGISRKNFVMKLPGGRKWETTIAQSAVESQAIYLAPFTIRLLDLTNFTIGMFPAGKFLLWTSIPAVEFAVMRYLEKVAAKTRHPKAIEMAREHRQGWEVKKKFFKDGHMRKLILKRWAYILRMKDEKADEVLKQLSKEYPEFFTYVSLKDGDLNESAKIVPFEFKNSQPQRKKRTVKESCVELYRIFISPPITTR